MSSSPSPEESQPPPVPEANVRLERRSRPRREPEKFDVEIGPLLSQVEPEVRVEIEQLVKAGRSAEAEQEILNYVAGDKSNLVTKATRQAARRDKRLVDKSTYILSLIPAMILLYCIFSLIFTGHIQFPWAP